MKLHGIDNPILVQSSDVHLGDALTYHCRERIEQTAGKLFNHLTEARVHFKREGAMTTCSIRMKVNALPAWTAAHEHHNIHRAFNLALSKVATQMRRTKRALHEDKPQRLDKDMAITPPTDPAKRKLLVPQPTDEIDEPYDLTTMAGADDYAKAMLQKAKQDAARQASDEDIAEWRGTNPPLAAE